MKARSGNPHRTRATAQELQRRVAEEHAPPSRLLAGAGHDEIMPAFKHLPDDLVPSLSERQFPLGRYALTARLGHQIVENLARSAFDRFPHRAPVLGVGVTSR